MFHHDRIAQVLPAAHRVGEMHFPVVAVIDISHRRRHATFSHHGVRFTQQRFTNHADSHTRARGFNRSAQSSTTSANDKHIMFMNDKSIRKTHKILQSVHTPHEHRRTYASVNPTQKRLIHAKSMCFELRKLTRP